MTAIPDGGHAEVEWGVRWQHGPEPCPHGAVHVENFSLCHSSGADQAVARQIASSRPQATLVAREVTYGPWVPVEIEATA